MLCAHAPSRRHRRRTADSSLLLQLLAIYTEGAYPLHLITVVPRGNALGYTSMLPTADKQSHSFAEYRAKLDVAMGGRVAEELIYGADNVTDGASSDISSATNIATSMVRRLGFSDAVGPVAHTGQASDGEPQPSEETLRVIDGEIRSLVEGAQERARACLTAKKVELERLARALVEYETLDSAEVQKGASPLSLSLSFSSCSLFSRRATR